MAIASLKSNILEFLLKYAKISTPEFIDHMDKRKWFKLSDKLSNIFKPYSRDYRCAIMEGNDACFAPVLSISEGSNHPYNKAMKKFIKDRQDSIGGSGS